jgi:energy-coupling factor transporter ATP-binding protein EcfA2
MVHDFLHLRHQSFSKHCLLVFTGASGSGKSTALRFLEETHPEFQNQQLSWILGSPISWETAEIDATTVFIDELHNLKDAARTYWLVATGKRVVVASHLPGWVFWPLRVLGRVAIFKTDTQTEKLDHYLRHRQIEFSPEALRAFASKYRATYTDLEIILERSPGQSFDQALKSFERFNSLSVGHPTSYSWLNRR